jgi:hypothetical protein
VGDNDCDTFDLGAAAARSSVPTAALPFKDAHPSPWPDPNKMHWEGAGSAANPEANCAGDVQEQIDIPQFSEIYKLPLDTSTGNWTTVKGRG